MLKKIIATILILILSMNVVYGIDKKSTNKKSPSIQKSIGKPISVQKEINCLGEAIYREARGESVTGMASVGLVVMNRVKSEKFPDTVCGVTHQKTDGMCQFSYACMKHLPTIKEDEKFRSFYMAKMIYRNQVKDITNGSTFFDMGRMSHNKKMHISKSIKVGPHQFYKERN
jgi:spore germination cell wall hydrolase CwlJ-like protein